MTDPSDEYLPFDKRITRPWVCKAGSEECERMKPCRPCLGRRSRNRGKKKQLAAKKMLGIPNAKFRGQDSDEENFGGLLRTECKSGLIAKPVWTKFAASEKQSEQNRAIGDNRPFVATFMPEGTTDGLLVVRLSLLPDVVAALYHHFTEES